MAVAAPPEFCKGPRTLDELDPPAWGPPGFDSSLITRCHELRTKPLGRFTAEDLRIMIGQQINLGELVPLTSDLLEADPLVEGDYYPGDLLTVVPSLCSGPSGSSTNCGVSSRRGTSKSRGTNSSTRPIVDIEGEGGENGLDDQA